MQGINKSKHVHLLKALIQLQELSCNDDNSFVLVKEITAYKNELDLMYKDYNRYLCKLEQHIIAYDELHRKVKIQYLGRKLKELRRNALPKDTAVISLVTDTLRSYGTY